MLLFPSRGRFCGFPSVFCVFGFRGSGLTARAGHKLPGNTRRPRVDKEGPGNLGEKNQTFQQRMGNLGEKKNEVIVQKTVFHRQAQRAF